MRIRPLLPLILCLLASAVPSLRAQRRVLKGPPHFRHFSEYKADGRFTRVVLRNGLTLLVEEHSLYPLAVVTASLSHPKLTAPQLSAARVLARAVLSDGEVSKEVAALGGRLEITVDSQTSEYSLTVPARRLGNALKLQSNLLKKPFLGASSPDRLVREMADQDRLRESAPARSALSELLREPALQSFAQPLIRPGQVTSDLLKAVHGITHRPERTVLVITGAVFAEGLMAKVAEFFADWKGSGTPARLGRARSITSIPAPSALQFRHRRHGSGGHLVLAALPLVGSRHADYPALQLLSHVLGTGRASLLGRFGIDPKGAILDAQVSIRDSGDRSLLLIEMRPDPAQVDRAEVLLLTQMQVLAQATLRQSQLQRAKALWQVDFFQQMQRLDRRARLLAAAQHGGDYKNRDSAWSTVDKLTVEDLRRVAKTYFKRSRLTVLEIFPESAEERSFTSQSFDETMQLLVKGTLAEQLKVMDALADTVKAPKSVVEFEPRFVRFEPKRTSIMRGPEIYFQEQHDVPLVHFGIYFAGGLGDESPEVGGITELLLRAMARGGGEGGQDLDWEAIESMGAQLETVVEPDFFGYRATLLSSYREDFFGAVLSWLRRARFSEAGIAIEKRRMTAQFERSRGEREADFLWTRRQLFIDHPLAKNRYGSRSSIASLTADGLGAWKTKHVDEVHPWLIVRGDLEGTSFLHPFVRGLTNSRLRTVRLGRKAVDDPAYEDAEVTPQVQQAQTVSVTRDGFVLLGYGGPAKGTREEWILDIFENLLQGVDGNLGTLLQTEPEHAPRVSVGHFSGRDRGAVFAWAETDAASQDALEALLGRQLAQLADVQIRPVDWRRALDATITQFHRRMQDGEAYSTELASLVAAGAYQGFEKAYVTTVLQARPEDLQSLALTYFAVRDDEESEEGSQED